MPQAIDYAALAKQAGAVSSAPPPPAPGSELTRVDAGGAIGVDHDAIVHGIADWASKLPPKWQKPAAFIATLPADMLGSLAEMLSSPESVAAVGAKPVSAAIDAAVGARRALQQPADIALDALVKKTGLDPDALDLASTRMRLQAARSRTRQADALADLAKQRATSDGALSAADEAALYKQGYSPATVEKIKAAVRQSAVVPSASPVASPPAAATVPASPVPSTAAQSPTVEAPPSAPAPSPQQMLNEEALARRRAAYQASQAAPPAVPAKAPSFGPQGILNMEIQGPNGPQSVGSVVAEMQKAGTPQGQIDRWLQGLERSASQPTATPTAAKATLKASESPEYMRLIKAGKTHQQAMDVIEANRALQERLGLSTPTAADARFPKGFRGKVDPE